MMMNYKAQNTKSYVQEVLREGLGHGNEIEVKKASIKYDIFGYKGLNLNWTEFDSVS